MPEGVLYQRQNKIQGLTIPPIASVVGCGGTGFWTAVFLAMSGVGELVLIDPDTIEISNLNRLPVCEDTAGRNKTAAAAEFITQVRKSVRLELHEKAIKKPADCTILRGTIFCCTDNLKSQQLICAYCRKNDLRYQRIGYDGTTLNVSKAFPLSFEEATDEGGYTITPSWVIPAAVAAGLGVFSKLSHELCVMDDLAKLNIVQSSYIPEGIKDELREEGETEILDNITDHIPEDYGYCGGCDYVPDGYGYCGDCDRVDPSVEEYGYCPDCDRLTEDALEKAKEESHEDGFNEGVDDVLDSIKRNRIEESAVRDAVDTWFTTKVNTIRKGEASNELVFSIRKAIHAWEQIQMERRAAQIALGTTQIKEGAKQ